MKKVILLFTLLTLITSCAFLEPSNYRNCSYNEEDGLFYVVLYKLKYRKV